VAGKPKPSRGGAPGGLDRASGFPFPLENSVRRVFPSTASNGPSRATFDDIPGLKCRPHPPHESVLYATAVAAPRNTRSPKGLPVRDPFGSMWHDPQQLHQSIQRPLARHRVLLSRRVVASYGLIRASESLPATYEFAAEAATPKESRLEVGIQRVPNLLRWNGLACRLPYPGGPEE
jgi:hypothetical protein